MPEEDKKSKSRKPLTLRDINSILIPAMREILKIILDDVCADEITSEKEKAVYHVGMLNIVREYMETEIEKQFNSAVVFTRMHAEERDEQKKENRKKFSS